MKKQNDTISRAAVLDLIKEIGGCDAQDQYGRGWDNACEIVDERGSRDERSYEGE